MESKEVTPQFVQTAVRDIANMGHTKIILKNDNEPSIKALASQVKDTRSHPTSVEESPE